MPYIPIIITIKLPFLLILLREIDQPVSDQSWPVCFRDETEMRMWAEQPPEGAGLSSKRGIFGFKP